MMHPGPMNRGVEILVDPSELPGAVITQQVTNGVAVRMAVLFDLLSATADVAEVERVTRADPRRAGGRPDGGAGRRRPRRRRPRRRRRRPTSATPTPCSTPAAASWRPGFVDLHTHLREPGTEEAETIETGSRAAALGGYTAVVAMPNTDPAQDSRGVVDFVRAQGEAAGLCEVLPAGCITIGRAGEQLAPFAELADAGVRLFTDDGNGVQDPLLMRRAMEYSLGLDIVLAQHCEVSRLTAGAVMHEGQLLQRARPARLAGDRRGADGPPRHRAGPPDRAPASTCCTCRRRAASSSCGRPRPTACPSPPSARRTTSRSPTRRCAATTRCSRSTRRCARPPTSPR